MLDWPYWGLVGGVLGAIATTIAGTLGFFIKETLNDLKRTGPQLEKRLSDRLSHIAEEQDAIESEVLRLRATVFEELKGLQDDFVPRRELSEIVRGMRETAELNAKVARDTAESNRRQLEGLGKKLDHILMALGKRPPDE